MTSPSETFGRLLRGMINSIAAYESKSAAAVEEELGASVGLSGAAIQRYKAGAVPPDPRTVQTLAEAAIRRGYLGRAWLQRFLQAAHYPAAADLLSRMTGDPALPARLPSGTLVFLFTDIAGSTQRWERERIAMEQALIRHDALMRHAIELGGGQVFKTVGDAFYAVFATAPQALDAAIAAQRALIMEPWPTATPIQVRMAIHAGAAEVRDGDYFGAPLNRVARLCAAGHGGQVLLSAAAVELVCDSLAPDVTLRALGERRLKDLGRPERIFQVIAPDLPTEFPRLNALDQYRHNLPTEATALIGREHELQRITELLRTPERRIVTLTGPGGIGKTRLALHAAADLLDDYPDGVWFVPLAMVRDSARIFDQVAQSLGLPQADDRPPSERVRDYLRHRSLLLVLDNVEQIPDAAPLIGDLLADAPEVRALITSRTPLRLYGEREVAVPPLGLPDPLHPAAPERLTQYDALRLFIERATAARPDFTVTNETAPVIAEICARLDGLPLAIELAASRSRLFPPRALLHRLDQRLSMLTGGARDLPARHQTLRNTIAWSYDMLDIAEQTLFARLAVFAGGWNLTAVERVCATSELSDSVADVAALPASDIVTLIEALVVKSLVRVEERDDGEPRFTMLETIREYAQERLLESGERDRIFEQLAQFLITGADAADLEGPEQHRALEHLAEEYPQIEAALNWCAAVSARAELGLRLVMALGRFWNVRGHRRAAREWCRQLLGQAVPVEDVRARARALVFAATLEIPEDLNRAESWLSEALAHFRTLGDDTGVAETLQALGGVAHERGDLAQARVCYEESLVLLGDDPERTAVQRFNLGQLARDLGDREGAQAHMEASLQIMRQRDDATMIGAMLRILGLFFRDAYGNDHEAQLYLEESLLVWERLGANVPQADILADLGELALRQGRLDTATAYYERCLDVAAATPAEVDRAWPLRQLSYAAFLRGDGARARALAHESLQLFAARSERDGIAACVDVLARIWAGTRPDLAAQLWGMADALATQPLAERWPHEAQLRTQEMADVRMQLGEAAFTAAAQTGRRQPLDRLIRELDNLISPKALP